MNAPATSITQADMDNNGVSVVIESASRFAKELEEGGLKHAVRHLQGERVLVVSNREPYIHEHDRDQIRVLHPASGLVTALEPVMRACSGVWIAHGSGSADRLTSDSHGRIAVPAGQEAYTLKRVWLSSEEERG